MLVMKFGGTSVGSAARMKEVARLVTAQPGDKIVVLSAMSGTTNNLVEISGYLHHNNISSASEKILELEDKYLKVVTDLLQQESSVREGQAIVQEHFRQIRYFTEDLFTAHEEKAVLAQGELLSTALFELYLRETGVPSILLPALDFMRIDEDGEPELHYLTEKLTPLLKDAGGKIVVTQGFICRNSFGEIDNLKRGGSDYTASLIGAAIHASEIQIWTDISGMHNNDPRVVSKTVPVEEISFDEAAELAYFGAKILHPSSVLPARLRNIPVKLLNTMEPAAKGTLISNRTMRGTIKAVAAKDGITVINIRSGRMLMAYGFLRAVFEVFERYKTSIDLITTSEVALTITIDNDRFLGDILNDLKRYGIVEVEGNQTIVCMVGDSIAENRGLMSELFAALEIIPLRMICYGGSAHNVSVVIPGDFKQSALQVINTRIFKL